MAWVDPQKTDNADRLYRGCHECTVLKQEEGNNDTEAWFKVVSDRNLGRYQSKKSYMVLLKQVQPAVNSNIEYGNARFRPMPNMTHRPIPDMLQKEAFKVAEPEDSLVHIRRFGYVPSTTWTALSCTCPDWMFRGVHSQVSHCETRRQPAERGGVEYGILRAFQGCKHMKCAEIEANGSAAICPPSVDEGGAS